nr:MAG TPA_asm: hypothetical protein [Caudoviricetes sp.]
MAELHTLWHSIINIKKHFKLVVRITAGFAILVVNNVPAINDVGAVVPVVAVKVVAGIDAAGTAIAEEVCDDTAKVGPAVTIIGWGAVSFHFAVVEKALNTGWTAVPVEINTDGRAVMLRIGAARGGNNCTVTHGKVSFQSIVIFIIVVDVKAVKDINQTIMQALGIAAVVTACAVLDVIFVVANHIVNGCFDIGFGIGFHGM